MSVAEIRPQWSSSKVRLFDCDEDGIYGSQHSALLCHLVSRWVGVDAFVLDHVPDIPEWVCSALTDPSDLPAHTLATSLRIAMEAVKGELKSKEPPEVALLQVRSFWHWAEQVRLPRLFVVDAPGGRASTYETRSMRVARQVVERHYRFDWEGGTYDPDNPDTHPHPDDVKRTIRELGITVELRVEELYRHVRDERIPYGRRKHKKL